MINASVARTAMMPRKVDAQKEVFALYSSMYESHASYSSKMTWRPP
jgi:hypothetical protein